MGRLWRSSHSLGARASTAAHNIDLDSTALGVGAPVGQTVLETKVLGDWASISAGLNVNSRSSQGRRGRKEENGKSRVEHLGDCWVLVEEVGVRSDCKYVRVL